MLIDLRFIPHNEQRYETVGDYWWGVTQIQDKGGLIDTLHVRVSKLGRVEWEWLVAQHEIQEAMLSRLAGIEEPDAKAFDEAYEAAREADRLTPCGCRADDEPGFDPHAPYYLQHKIADTCERVTALAMGLDWNAYGNKVESLSKDDRPK